MRNSTIDIQPLGSTVGAEIGGVDLTQSLSGRTIGDIRDALNTHGVIFFRDQDVTPAQHVAFTERFGPIMVSEFMTPVDGFQQVSEVRKEADQTRNTGGNWHTDHPFDTEPPLGSILVARELPEIGGDTLFASMYAAYDNLSDGLKRTLASLKAVHSKRQAYDPSRLSAERQVGAEEQAEVEALLAKNEAITAHPVVCRHPESGREVLFVNPNYTVRFEGWTQEESLPLLRYLYAQATRPENTCRFHWRDGSIAFWDNRSTLHLALNDYHGSRRLMHRTTVTGSRPQAA